MGLIIDIYFIKIFEVLKYFKREDVYVKVEIFVRKEGIFCGFLEVLNFLKDVNCKVYFFDEGESFFVKEVVMRIEGRYVDFGIYEIFIFGIFVSLLVWVIVVRRCKEVVG